MFKASNLKRGSKVVTVDHFVLKAPLQKRIYVHSGYNELEFIGGRGFYLIIGIEEYRYLEQALGAIEDARAVNGIFAEHSAFTVDQIMLLSGEATKKRIKGDIYNIARRATAHDYFVLYFAGLMRKDALSPYDDKENGWGNAITDGELEEWLSGFPGEVTVILDGADGASFADGDIFPQALKTPKYTVLSSTKVGEEAILHPDSGHGLFTHYLIKGLKNQPYRVDSNGDGLISSREIFEYIRVNIAWFLSENGNYPQQTPYLWEYGNKETILLRYR